MSWMFLSPDHVIARVDRENYHALRKGTETAAANALVARLPGLLSSPPWRHAYCSFLSRDDLLDPNQHEQCGEGQDAEALKLVVHRQLWHHVHPIGGARGSTPDPCATTTGPTLRRHVISSSRMIADARELALLKQRGRPFPHPEIDFTLTPSEEIVPLAISLLLMCVAMVRALTLAPPR